MSINAKEAFQRLNLPQKAQWCSMRYCQERATSRGMRNGNPLYNRRSFTEGVMIEVYLEGAFGYAATHDVSLQGLQKAVDRALIQAELASQYPVTRFPRETVRPSFQGTYRSSITIPPTERSSTEINELLRRLSTESRITPNITQAEASCEFLEVSQEYLSTADAHTVQELTITSVDLELTGQEGREVQKRSFNGFRGVIQQAGAELLEEEVLFQRAKYVAQEVLQLLTAEECPTERMSLVLSPDQMMLQIHESIGHPLELDRILGDERNYAGWSFVRPEDFGTLKYGSPLLNVVFDPELKGELASYAYDDVGAKASREYLIKEGVLLRGIGGLESQYRLGIPGVASQRACQWNRPPIDRMANINVEAGTSSLSDILSSIERGVLMRTNRSWSIDDYRRKFQFGCEFGQLIEEGRITKVVKNPNYRGVTTPFWHSLTHIGDSSTFEFYGTPNCGKGEPNQSIRVGHASPVCAFKEIEVFGGAA